MSKKTKVTSIFSGEDVGAAVQEEIPTIPLLNGTPPTAPVTAADVAAAALEDVEDAKPKEVPAELTTILSWKRGHDTPSELEFCRWVKDQIEACGYKPFIATLGCITLSIPRPDGKKNSTLFACHVDTTNRNSNGTASDKQGLIYDPGFGHVYLDKKDPNAGSCLGSDDGAGVWLLLEMIKAKKPGSYIFHRGEERGGLGASALAVSSKEWLRNFDIAVEFDRPNNHEVIRVQGGSECASEKFSKALAVALNAKGMDYEVSTKGVYTDVKEYRKIIPEVVNIGVGYNGHHTQDEYLDLAHLLKLRAAVLAIDWESLPVDRNPEKAEEFSKNNYKWPKNDNYKAHGHQNYVTPLTQYEKERYGAFMDDYFPRKLREIREEEAALAGAEGPVGEYDIVEEAKAMSMDVIYESAENDPSWAGRVIASLLVEIESKDATVAKLRSLLEL